MTTMTVVATPQQMEALEKGNATRRANAQLRRDLKQAGPEMARLMVAAVLRDPDEQQGACPAERLLLAIPRVGPTAVRSMLKQIGVNTTRRKVRELSPRQRDQLADMLLGVRQEWEVAA